MRLINLVPLASIAALITSAAPASSQQGIVTQDRQGIILEDEGLYEKQRWSIGKRYDDLDEPSDAPGIITSGQDPAAPSGPAVDLGVPSGPPEDVTGTVDLLGD